MLKYVLTRISQTIIVLFGVTLLTFILLNVAPGDPVAIMLEKRADPVIIERVRRELGLDRPLHIQYLDYIGKAIRGDLGTSYFQKTPVIDMVVRGFKVTIRLGALSLLLALSIGLVVGTLTAIMRGKWIDRFLMIVTMLGISAPVFWIAVILQIVFGLMLGWLPISGSNRPGWLIMPVVCLGISYGASSARLIRTNMIETLGEEYIRTARAKGVSEILVICKHALKSTAIPIITLAGMQLRSLICGAMVVEAVFSIYGIGSISFNAIQARDIPIIQGCVLYIATVYVLINLSIDLLYGVLDPRIRIESGAK